MWYLVAVRHSPELRFPLVSPRRLTGPLPAGLVLACGCAPPLEEGRYYDLGLSEVSSNTCAPLTRNPTIEPYGPSTVYLDWEEVFGPFESDVFTLGAESAYPEFDPEYRMTGEDRFEGSDSAEKSSNEACTYEWDTTTEGEVRSPTSFSLTITLRYCPDGETADCSTTFTLGATARDVSDEPDWSE